MRRGLAPEAITAPREAITASPEPTTATPPLGTVIRRAGTEADVRRSGGPRTAADCPR